MEDPFVPFRTISFNTPEAKEELEQLLIDNGVEYEVTENVTGFDPVYFDNSFSRDYIIRLKKEDFDLVSQLLDRQSIEMINHLPSDYYLFRFSDAELLAVVSKSDEWNPLDVQLAIKLLNQRGKFFRADDLDRVKQNRLAVLSVPDDVSFLWTFTGYLLATTSGSHIPRGNYFVAIVHSLVALTFGWLMQHSWKVLPDGTRIHRYSENDRMHARRFVYLVPVCLVFWLIVKVCILLFTD